MTARAATGTVTKALAYPDRTRSVSSGGMENDVIVRFPYRADIAKGHQAPRRLRGASEVVTGIAGQARKRDWPGDTRYAAALRSGQ
jgi:hypothetical protein